MATLGQLRQHVRDRRLRARREVIDVLSPDAVHRGARIGDGGPAWSLGFDNHGRKIAGALVQAKITLLVRAGGARDQGRQHEDCDRRRTHLLNTF